MTRETLLALLQLGDGLFPAGGFAHSFGLETYAQEGRVRDRVGLEAFVTAHLEGAAGPGDAVAVAVDARLAAMKAVPEFRAASRQMGRQTARVAAALGEDTVLASIARAIDDGLAPGHHAAVFGAAAGRLGAEPEAGAAAYLYSTAALLVGAGLRLLPLGQLDGQRVLAAMRPRIARLAAEAARATAEDMWTFTPALELAGLRHAS